MHVLFPNMYYYGLTECLQNDFKRFRAPDFTYTLCDNAYVSESENETSCYKIMASCLRKRKKKKLNSVLLSNCHHAL